MPDRQRQKRQVRAPRKYEEDEGQRGFCCRSFAHFSISRKLQPASTLVRDCRWCAKERTASWFQDQHCQVCHQEIVEKGGQQGLEESTGLCIASLHGDWVQEDRHMLRPAHPHSSVWQFANNQAAAGTGQ